MTVSMALTWIDERLKWNLADFNMISFISVDQRKIWNPEVHIMNRAHELTILDEYKYKVKVDSEGHVYAIRNFRFKADFEADISNYPSDIQTPVFTLATIENHKQMVVLSTEALTFC